MELISYPQNRTILNLRGQELSVHNGQSLAQIAQGQLEENRHMKTMTDKMYEDSRTVRIATIVAMFYLPATLVLVSI